MEIIKAKLEDIPSIIEIKNDALKLFKALQDPQWDEEYPSEKEFISDINKGELYIARERGNVLGFAVLSLNAHDDEYQDLNFTSLQSSLTFCRFAVKEKARGKGVGQALFDFALKKAKEIGKRYVITDTHKSNIVMQRFLEKNNFHKVDTLSFPSTPGLFIAFEREI